MPDDNTINPEDLADLIADRLVEKLNRNDRPLWLSVSSASAHSSLSEDSIRGLISSGKLTAHRPLKGKILINREELDSLIRSGANRKLRKGRGIKQR